MSHATAQFAVAAIRRWWSNLGAKRFPKATRLLITADSGGSNSPRTRLWRLELQKLADDTRLILEVCHYPPGTSQWNKVEHRLLCHITFNWQDAPLKNLEVVVNLIANTRTQAGLEVYAWLDENVYPKQITVTDEQLADIKIRRNKFYGEWYYYLSLRHNRKNLVTKSRAPP